MKTTKTAKQQVQEPVQIIDRLGMVSGFFVSDQETYVQAADRVERVWKGMHPIPVSSYVQPETMLTHAGSGRYLEQKLSHREFRTVLI